MSVFLHSRDGLITIDDWTYPLEEFLLDEPNYTPPKEGMGVTYISGVKLHAVSDKESISLIEGERPIWPDGELYLSKKTFYMTEYFKRHPPKNPTEPPKADPRLAELRTALDEALKQMVIGPGSVRAVFEAWRKLL